MGGGFETDEKCDRVFWQSVQKQAVSILGLIPIAPLLLLAGVPQLRFYDPGPEHRGLVDALRIRLRDRLVEHAPLQGATFSERIRWARAGLFDVSVGAWVETSSISGVVVMVVSERPGLPSVESVSVAGPPGFDRDRAVALKVHEILAKKSFSPRMAAAPEPLVESPDPHWKLDLEIGGLGVAGDHDAGLRGGGFAAIGPGLEIGRWHVQLRTGGEYLTGLRLESDAGVVSIREWAWTIGLGMSVRVAGVSVGPTAGMKLRFLEARGTTLAGATDARTLWMPSVNLGGDLQVPLSNVITLRALLGGGVNLQRRLLAVNDVPIVDLGSRLVLIQISLLISVF